MFKGKWCWVFRGLQRSVEFVEMVIELVLSV